MNDHDALLRAIGAHPEEDTPRLMYADWLEENGDPDRAAFVRNQVAMARFDLNDPARVPLVWANKRYLTDLVPLWKAELPRSDGVEWGDFNRGLIEEVQASSEAPLVERTAAVFGVPGVHILRLRRLARATDLARLPELDRLRALRMVSAHTSAAALRTLLDSPHLIRLTVLDLHGTAADDGVAADLADGRFPDLAELWLGSNAIGNRGALALASTRHLPRLRLLDLRGNAHVGQAARAALQRRFGSALSM